MTREFLISSLRRLRPQVEPAAMMMTMAAKAADCVRHIETNPLVTRLIAIRAGVENCGCVPFKTLAEVLRRTVAQAILPASQEGPARSVSHVR